MDLSTHVTTAYIYIYILAPEVVDAVASEDDENDDDGEEEDDNHAFLGGSVVRPLLNAD